MSDGSRLRQSWYTALSEAEAHFRQLLTSPAAEWKRLSHSADVISAKQKGKGRLSSVPELADVVVHRNSTKSGEDIYRMVLEVPTGDEQVSLEPWKAVLTTPELRQEWDPAVEDAHLLEMFDRNTRISKTNYSLGWPANPRDSITISRAFHDATTLIDITTSLPRSPDEPAYLRPSPPFVRSHVKLFAWCIQYIQPQPPSPSGDKKSSTGGRLRMTCFWQHDLKALWGFGSSTATLTQQLSTMTLSLLKTVMKRGGRVPKLVGYGNGISIERVRYQIDREALTIDYAIIPDDDEHHELGLQGMEEVHALREHRRLTRSIECVLPSMEGWDVQVTLKGSSEEVEKIPWSAHAMRTSSSPSTFSPPDQVLLRLTHGALTHEDAVLKIKVVIEVSGGTRGLRLNGLQTKIHDLEERDPSSYVIPQKMLQDVASAVDLSIQTSSSLGTVSSGASSSNGMPLARPNPERTPAAEKSILSKVRRNYIYFSSLLQEPEAKWKRTTEARGVSITQLDSIDPTLVVYRAEATFVGVGLWDLFGAVVTPGARVYWDKQHEDGTLLEHVNELTELWHFKTKPAWPVNGRDSVVLKTVYKSPTTIHVFSFSAEDPHLFPHIPPPEPGVIRTQVDLQGWAIEALSPTTTLLTLLEQSDPKGWTNKTSIPTTMINTLAGIGEFAIKCGGPPIVTRMTGAKANELRYDHERGTFKVEYEPCLNRNSGNSTPNSQNQDDSGMPAIECEIRCDIDTWAASLDIVVDPPPQTITCLRRHRLSAEGGGLWLTLNHDAIFLDDERLLVLVRRAPGKEKGLVMVNGAKVQVDVEELPEHEIKTLSRQKRVKPPRIPLDQPPVMGVIRRRKAEWSGAEGEETAENKGEANGANATSNNSWASAPKISSPLSRFFTYAVDQATTTTQQAVAAISPANAAGGSSALDPAKSPMHYALEALAWTQDFNSKPFSQEGWTMVADKGLLIQRKLIPEISPLIPVHRGFKVIEGVSAEELASVITEYDCRKTWDERFDSARILESYGGQARTTFLVAKGGFPFRDRGFYLANVVAREHLQTSGSVSVSRRNTGDMAEQSPTARNAIFCVSASFSAESDAAKAFDATKYNSYGLPIGRVYLDAWILETLDPYTKENYAIPSSRCTRLVAVDYAGSIPAAFNSMINATLAKGVLAVETFMKGGGVKAALPVTRLPANSLVLSANEKKEEDERGVGAEGGASTSALGGVGSGGWKLRKKDENRVLLETKFDVEKKVYRSSVLVVLPPSKEAAPSSQAHATEESSATVVNGPFPASSGGPISANTGTGGAHDKEASSSSNAITPRPSHLSLSNPSPHGHERQRLPSDASLPDTIHSADSEFTELDDDEVDDSHDEALSSSIALLPMPGSMIVTPAPTKAFPSSSTSSQTLPRTQTPNHRPTTTHLRASTSVSPTRPPLGPHALHDRQTSSSSAIPTSPPRMRQRAASSSAGMFYSSPAPHAQAYSSPSSPAPQIRGRTTSAAVLPSPSVRGKMSRLGLREREKDKDLVVMEVVVDSRMFYGGSAGKGYKVDVRARRRDGVQVREGVVGLSKLGLGSSSSSSSIAPTNSSTSNPTPSNTTSDATIDVPFITTLYTLPSSPLHSSSLSEGDASPVRHLVRVSLPTAKYQYQGPGWEDPLMLRSPSGSSDVPGDKKEGEKEKEDKPERFTILSDTGIVVDLVVSPLTSPSAPSSSSTASLNSNSKTPSKGSKGVLVKVNGEEKRVLGEKESLGALGREELVDDRVGRMGVLVRTRSPDSPSPPEDLKPIGVADDLLVPLPLSLAVGLTSTGSLRGSESGETLRGGSTGTGGEVKGGEVKMAGEDSPNAPSEKGALLPVQAQPDPAPSGPGSFLGVGFGSFLGLNMGPLVRFGSGSVGGGVRDDASATSTSIGASRDLIETSGMKDRERAPEVKKPEGTSSAPRGGSSAGREATGERGPARRASTSSASSASSSSSSGPDEPGPDTAHSTKSRTRTRTSSGTKRTDTHKHRQKHRHPHQNNQNSQTQKHKHMYPLSTLLLVGLIAFLIGSLLRSLLSPADFIYVVSGEAEAGEGGVLSSPSFSGAWDGDGGVNEVGNVLNEGPGGGEKGVNAHLGNLGHGPLGSLGGQGAGQGAGGQGPHGAQAQAQVGWREIRRLLEIKYLAGGWDFQVAVVRRH